MFCYSGIASRLTYTHSSLVAWRADGEVEVERERGGGSGGMVDEKEREGRVEGG